jgi:long-chain-fatty-acid--CoA ligase ACSBG
MSFAKSLHFIGVDSRKAVNIMGFNSPEWAIAYFGSMMHNNVVSGVYTTNGADACQYQAEHSEAQVIVVESINHLKMYLSIIDQIPEVKALVCWGVDKIPEDLQKDSRIYTYRNFLDLGPKIEDDVIDEIS